MPSAFNQHHLSVHPSQHLLLILSLLMASVNLSTRSWLAIPFCVNTVVVNLSVCLFAIVITACDHCDVVDVDMAVKRSCKVALRPQALLSRMLRRFVCIVESIWAIFKETTQTS